MNFSANESFAHDFIDNHTKSKSYFSDFLENIEKTMRSYYLHLPKIKITKITLDIMERGGGLGAKGPQFRRFVAMFGQG